MDSNFVLIQGVKDVNVEETMKGFDEWGEFWFDWVGRGTTSMLIKVEQC